MLESIQKMNNTIKLAWLFPSTLYLHGERGNILAFQKIANDNGIDLNIQTIELGQDFNPTDFDIIYCPAGETIQAETVIEALLPIKNDLVKFIKSGKPFIVTGNSIGFFGKKIIRNNHSEIDGLNLIDIITTERDAPYGDDLYFQTKYNNKDLVIFGNQIQLNNIKLGDSKPFGRIKYGYGNNGTDLNEGIILNNSFFTNTLGPLFVLNPWLTVEVLNIVLNKKNLKTIKTDQSFKLEKQSLNSKIKYIENKKTNLKNINPEE